MNHTTPAPHRTTDILSWKSFGSDVRETPVEGESTWPSSASISPLLSSSPKETEGSDSLWYLSLVSHNGELMRAASQLFIQFNQTYTEAVASATVAVEELQEKQQKQLSSLFEFNAVKSMIVNSSITEDIVLQHQREILSLQEHHNTQQREMEAQLKSDILAVLKASAPDAIKALTLRQAPLTPSSPVTVSKRRLEFPHVKRYVPVTDVSAFVHNVPTRTVLLENFFLKRVPPKLVRPSDSFAQPIVLDVSPLPYLKRCLASCYSKEKAAVEHLMRLSHTKSSLLFLIGSESEANRFIRSIPYCELLLQGSRKDTFTPVRRHPFLKVLFSTRLWGGNIVLLFDPSKTPDIDLSQAVHDVLNLASSWNIDMLSVAVLDPNYLKDKPTKSLVQSSLTATMCDLLKHLQVGISKIVLEKTGVRLPPLWTVQDEELLSRDYWDDRTNSFLPPVAVGFLKSRSSEKKSPLEKEVRFNTTTAIRVFLPISEDSLSPTAVVERASEQSFSSDPSTGSDKSSLMNVLEYVFGNTASIL